MQILDKNTWTPEYRNEIRLMVRKLNGVIDSLNYKYWRFKNIAYIERRYSHLCDLKKESEQRIARDLRHANEIITEIKSIENELENANFIKTMLKTKKLKARLRTLRLELICYNNSIKREEAYKKHIDKKIIEECSSLKAEQEKRQQIKDAYRKQLLKEYNPLVNRLNIMSISRIVLPKQLNTFEELTPVQYWQFRVDSEMEQVETENE